MIYVKCLAQIKYYVILHIIVSSLLSNIEPTNWVTYVRRIYLVLFSS